MPKNDIQTAIPGAILDLGAALDTRRGVGSRRVGQANTASTEQDAAFEDRAADVRRVVGRLDDAAEDLLAHKRAAPTDEGDHVMDGQERLAASTG
jgi:hypothetical protein